MTRQRRPNAGTLKEWARGFSLLSDRTRLGILAELSKGPATVTALGRSLKRKPPTISHHLALLRKGGFVSGTRRGKSVEYTAQRKALKELHTAIGRLTPK